VHNIYEEASGSISDKSSGVIMSSESPVISTNSIIPVYNLQQQLYFKNGLGTLTFLDDIEPHLVFYLRRFLILEPIAK